METRSMKYGKQSFNDPPVASGGPSMHETEKRGVVGSLVGYAMNMIIWGITRWIRDMYNTAKYAYDTLAEVMDMYNAGKSKRQIVGMLSKRAAIFLANRYLMKIIVGTVVILFASFLFYVRFVR